MIFESLRSIGQYVWKNRYRSCCKVLQEMSKEVMGNESALIFIDTTRGFSLETLGSDRERGKTESIYLVTANISSIANTITPFIKLKVRVDSEGGLRTIHVSGSSSKDKINFEAEGWKYLEHVLKKHADVYGDSTSQLELLKSNWSEVVNHVKQQSEEEYRARNNTRKKKESIDVTVILFLHTGEYDELICRKILDAFIRQKYEGEAKYRGKGVCYICGSTNVEVWGNANPYSFYTFDKKNFAPDIMESNAVKVFPVCENCIRDMHVGLVYTKSHLSLKLFGKNAVIVPRIVRSERNKLNLAHEKISEKVENAVESSISHIEASIKHFISDKKPSVVALFRRLSAVSDAIMYTMMFYTPKKSQIEVKGLVVDVPPSRLWKIHEVAEKIKGNVEHENAKWSENLGIIELTNEIAGMDAITAMLMGTPNAKMDFLGYIRDFLRNDREKNNAVFERIWQFSVVERFLSSLSEKLSKNAGGGEREVSEGKRKEEIEKAENLKLKDVILKDMDRYIDVSDPSQKFYCGVGCLTYLGLYAQAKSYTKGHLNTEALFSQPLANAFADFRIDYRIAKRLINLALSAVKIHKNIQSIDVAVLEITAEAEREMNKQTKAADTDNASKCFAYGLLTSHLCMENWIKTLSPQSNSDSQKNNDPQEVRK